MLQPISVLLSLLLLGGSPGAEDPTSVPVSNTGTENAQEYTIAFWNLENLFDYEDDPDNPGDDEYLPEKEWDQARYERKLDHLAKAIVSMEADLLAVCEVENRRVLEDLIRHQNLVEEQWAIVHQDSPDHRGIDLALLFTWREVARFKNSVNTNLLIMDEVFDSSLDGFGTETHTPVSNTPVVVPPSSPYKFSAGAMLLVIDFLDFMAETMNVADVDQTFVTRIIPNLAHSNPALVLSAAKVVLKFLDGIDEAGVVAEGSTLTGRIPLRTALGTNSCSHRSSSMLATRGPRCRRAIALHVGSQASGRL